MKLTIEIECDNEAFGELGHEQEAECRRILAKLNWSRLLSFGAINLQDVNGNTVGKAEVTE